MQIEIEKRSRIFGFFVLFVLLVALTLFVAYVSYVDVKKTRATGKRDQAITLVQYAESANAFVLSRQRTAKTERKKKSQTFYIYGKVIPEPTFRVERNEIKI